MAAHRLLFVLTGTLITGLASALPATARSAESRSETIFQAPANLKVRADRQYSDTKSKVNVAEGDVSVFLGNAELHADRIEFDAAYRTLYARGAVRFRRGSQYFQASSFRYNLVQQEGLLNDVYGVIDLEEPLSNPLNNLQTNTAVAESATPASRADLPPVACPPLLAPVPDWHPQPWAVTAWGGQMIDADFGPAFLFDGRMRPEVLLGIGLQKRIKKAGPFAIELEADFFHHIANQQQAGEFNQSQPYAELTSQSFNEVILGIGARLWVQPWLSFSVIEGVSYNTDVSLYEKTFRENNSQLLNYLGFEVEAALSPDLSLVGRIHHRSGVFGLYNGVSGGSNGYLLGLRYRWGRDMPKRESAVMPPLPACEGPDRAQRIKPSSLSDRLDSIAFGDGGLPQRHVSINKTTKQQSIPPAKQQSMRNEAIAQIDQRISNIASKGSFSIEQRGGIRTKRSNSSIQDENRFGAIRPTQLKIRGKTQLLTGTISRWRVQASKVLITKDGWKADRMGFSNDPFTPAQTRIDAEGVVAREQANGDVLISARRNRLIFEERLPIPVTRRQRIKGEEDVENRWVFGFDDRDRDGFYVGRNLKPIQLNRDFTLTLEPQFMVQRANNGETSSYPAPGKSADSEHVDQPTTTADLFGLEAKLRGQLWDWDINLKSDISSFKPQNFANGTRYWGTIENDFELPWVGDVTARLFGAYRYRTWNGSLGETNVYSALGGFIEQRQAFELGKLSNSYIWRIGAGNYQADSFTSTNLTETLRSNFYGSLTSSYPIWRGETAPLTPEKAYRYSPVAIVPGLSLNTNVNTLLSAYGNGTSQSTISLSGGSSLTLGTFSKPFLDYTKLSISGGITIKQGSSPFDFDQAIDLGTLGIGVTQQIAGPLILNAGFGVNVDPASEYYGDVIHSNIELSWQRRSYDIGLYLNPYEGIAGFRFRLHDFDFKGTGVPFVPYTPTNWMETTNTDRPF
ncbi:DUF3769 domain-containing protein [Synechococcus sp. MU1643]|uniref:DUF3769 domain-containing protein n=1 Tax=Synechococcus sp. MU1643 TaxID=2508349 RepID=UPI001CF8E8F5|nr:DUF3769 domain-containing protein [Synechococcus sp. MU1643]MCB4429005.1 DUF3769 domain-containing protein [Synechococcus sp. MU1643]